MDFNIFNKPDDVGQDNDIVYYYDGVGDKLEEQDNAAGINRYYVSGIEYTQNPYTTNPPAIDFIQTEEGRALPDGAGGFKYEYTLKDHLGNNRVNFDKNPSTLAARPVQETDYYPFGLSAVVTIFGTKNNYLYNGKELRDQFNEYDYGARFYDPVIGRFTSVDPMAEVSRRWSTYAYSYNNPVRFVDKDGMIPGDFLDEKGRKVGSDGKDDGKVML
jgi:RHS repeat-associated protein